MPINEQDFIARREPDWQALNALCAKADVSEKNLTSAELSEFVRLYRATCTDLAVAQTQTGNEAMVFFLNGLVGRAYSILYRAPGGKRFRDTLRDAIAEGARIVRRRSRFVWASLAVFACGVVFSATVLNFRPETRANLVSAQEETLFARWTEGKFDARTSDENALYWSMYATNNPRVTLIQVGSGIPTFGISTFIFNWKTGSQLGALGSDMARHGKLGFLISSLVPHGASELSGMIIGGSAGFLMGGTMIAPGRRSRTQALREAGKDGAGLLFMAFLMMFIAAPMEAFFSFNPAVPQWLKAIVGTLIFTAWMLYWTLYARESDPDAK